MAVVAPVHLQLLLWSHYDSIKLRGDIGYYLQWYKYCDCGLVFTVWIKNPRYWSNVVQWQMVVLWNDGAYALSFVLIYWIKDKDINVSVVMSDWIYSIEIANIINTFIKETQIKNYMHVALRISPFVLASNTVPTPHGWHFSKTTSSKASF